MAGPEKREKYAYLDQLSTERLQELLRADLESDSTEDHSEVIFHILEVMEWSIRQMVESTLQTSLRAETPEKAIEAFVSVAAEHGELLLRLLDSQRRAQIERVFVEALRSNMRRLLSAKRPDLAVNHQDLEVALNFCAYGIAGVLFENCKNRDLNVEQLSRQLSQLLSGNLI